MDCNACGLNCATETTKTQELLEERDREPIMNLPKAT